MLARLRSFEVGTSTPNESSTIAIEVGPQLDAWYSLPSNWLRIGTSSASTAPSIQPRTEPRVGESSGIRTGVGVLAGAAVALGTTNVIGGGGGALASAGGWAGRFRLAAAAERFVPPSGTVGVAVAASVGLAAGVRVGWAGAAAFVWVAVAPPPAFVGVAVGPV